MLQNYKDFMVKPKKKTEIHRMSVIKSKDCRKSVELGCHMGAETVMKTDIENEKI